MSIIDKLDRRIGRFAIPNLTLLLVSAQVIGFALFLSDEKLLDRMVFRAADVAAGEYWRVATFVFLPLSQNPIFCSKCAGSHEYCEEHLRTHEHIALGETAGRTTDTASQSAS